MRREGGMDEGGEIPSCVSYFTFSIMCYPRGARSLPEAISSLTITSCRELHNFLNSILIAAHLPTWILWRSVLSSLSAVLEVVEVLVCV